MRCARSDFAAGKRASRRQRADAALKILSRSLPRASMPSMLRYAGIFSFTRRKRSEARAAYRAALEKAEAGTLRDALRLSSRRLETADAAAFSRGLMLLAGCSGSTGPKMAELSELPKHTGGAPLWQASVGEAGDAILFPALAVDGGLRGRPGRYRRPLRSVDREGIVGVNVGTHTFRGGVGSDDAGSGSERSTARSLRSMRVRARCDGALAYERSPFSSPGDGGSGDRPAAPTAGCSRWTRGTASGAGFYQHRVRLSRSIPGGMVADRGQLAYRGLPGQARVDRARQRTACAGRRRSRSPRAPGAGSVTDVWGCRSSRAEVCAAAYQGDRCFELATATRSGA